MNSVNSLSNKTTLLIDADLYLYRSLAAVEEVVDWGDDVWATWADHKQAKKAFESQLKRFCDKLQTDHMIMCLSGTDNFRKKVDRGYKSARKKSRKPLGYPEFVTWCKEHYFCAFEDQLEADDVMGIRATTPEHDCIIVSDDKDMLTIPGRIYRPMQDELVHQSKEDADRQFYLQTLTGDNVDGYAGCPGIGPVKAEKILGLRPDWSLVERAFTQAALPLSYALQQARLARILRYEDWDDINKEVRLYRDETN